MPTWTRGPLFYPHRFGDVYSDGPAKQLWFILQIIVQVLHVDP